MNSQQHIHTLRVQLLAMSRLSQRALDYSLKGYEMRNLDFSRHVSTAGRELEEHHRQIKNLCRELVNDGIAKTSDFRLAFVALSIGTSLHVTYTAAVDIACDTMRLLESGTTLRSGALEDMAQLVNGSMRLCTVALFEKDAHHAETVIRSLESLELCDFTSTGSHPHRTVAKDDFEYVLTRNLGEVAKQVHEMADAIVFWLEGSSYVAVPAEDRHIAVALPPAPQQKSAATPSYMQLERVSKPKMTQTFSC